MTTTYVADAGYWGAEDGKEVWVCEDGKKVAPLPLRLDIANKSPTGFAWGYEGSGPCQLAIAILAHAVGDKIAGDPRFFQAYKRRVIGRLQQEEGFVISQDSVLLFVREQQEDDRASLMPMNFYDGH